MLGFNGIGSSWHADVGVAGMAPDDPAVVAAAIAAADQVADIVVVTIHWGVELASGPTSTDAALGRAMIEAGADAVLGHHPHVVQPMTTHLGRPIFWSLGNFVWHNRISRSAVAEIVIDPDGTVTGGCFRRRSLLAVNPFSVESPPVRAQIFRSRPTQYGARKESR